MSPTEHIILDTDIGSDIDDALALAYLLRQPRCDLLGVTTVGGEPERRAELVSVICRHAGRDDVPIFAGAGVSMLTPYMPWKGRAWQAEALGDWPRQRDFQSGDAIAFMRTTVRQHPGEVTLLAIGPLTNVGTLFAADPELPALLKRLVVMGGCYRHHHRSENNIRNDVIAASIALGAGPQSRPPDTLAVGWEVTTQCRLDAATCRRKLTAKVLEPVRDFMEVWFRNAEHATFHDPLAAAVIFEPELCTYASGRIELSLTEPTLGWTAWRAAEEDGESPHRIAASVDPTRFFEHFESIVNA